MREGRKGWESVGKRKTPRDVLDNRCLDTRPGVGETDIAPLDLIGQPLLARCNLGKQKRLFRQACRLIASRL